MADNEQDQNQGQNQGQANGTGQQGGSAINRLSVSDTSPYPTFFKSSTLLTCFIFFYMDMQHAYLHFATYLGKHLFVQIRFKMS